MIRIINSLFIILVVVTLVSSSTVAYFGDEEVSKDSAFVVGNLDLQIDSEAHYNDLVCRDGAWVADGIVESEENIIVEQIGDGSSGVGSIDTECQDFGFDFGIVKWEYEDGLWFTEGEGELGTILTGDDNDIVWDVSTSTADGIIVKAGNTVHYGIIGSSGIVTQSRPGLSHITFCGFEPPQECQGTWELTDLEDNEHILFSFEDLRVGDHGENTLSIHVQGNDAWSRIVIDNIFDEDNGCVEPELSADPDCNEVGDVGAEGELREYLLFNMWLDQGAIPGFQNTNRAEGDDGYDPEEGDNVRQAESEPLLFDSLNLDLLDNQWSLGTVIAYAYDTSCHDFQYQANGHNEHNICHGISQAGYLVGGATYYFGLAWELPEGASNAIQSDIFGGDVHFEIEQQRHNDLPFTD